MSMNNDLEQFSEEYLKELINSPADELTIALARIALAAKQAKPIGIYNQQLFNLQGSAVVLNIDKSVEAGFVSDDGELSSTRGYLYTTPQPAHTEQDGWKVVPIELTPEMRDAWDSAPNSEDDDVNMSNAYRAMLAAAPKPESE